MRATMKGLRARRANRGISTVTVHAGLLVVALGAAYATWTRDRTQVASTDMVSVLDVAKRDVDSLIYEDGDGRKHRIKSVRISGEWADCECEVSPS